MNLQHILMALDFSETSRAALQVARAIEAPDARRTLLHIVAPFPPFMQDVLFPYAALGEDEALLEQELVVAAENSLRQQLEPLEHESLQVGYGDPAEQLPEAIHRSSADLLIVGNSSSPHLPHRLGQHAELLLSTCAQPMLLVRRHHAQNPRPRSILLATDLGPRAHEVLRAALDIALLHQATLQTLFVLPEPRARDVHELVHSSARFHPDKALQKQRSKIDALFERMYQQLHVHYPEQVDAQPLLKRRSVVVGDPDQIIHETAAKQDVDLIVLGSRSSLRGEGPRLGRTARHTLRESNAQVLVFPITEGAQKSESN